MIKENNIRIEKLDLKHTSSIYNLTESNREYLKEWLPWLDKINSSNDTKKFIEYTLEEFKKELAFHFVILYENEVCGIISFNEIKKDNGIGYIGYWIAKSYSNKGIASFCVKKLLDIGFKKLNLNKIEIRCAQNNHKSIAIPKKLGFTYEGTLRQNEWLYTKYVNQVVYSMLKEEYNS